MPIADVAPWLGAMFLVATYPKVCRRWQPLSRETTPETESWKWVADTFGYMLALAYVAAFMAYNAAKLLGAG